MRQNALEWAVLITSIGAIGLVALLLVMEGLGPMSPADPALELRPAEGRTVALGWSVPGTLSNRGEDAAESVVVEATATVEGQEETSEIEVPFLPAGSTIDVHFGFSAPPDGPIESRLVGYRVP